MEMKFCQSCGMPLNNHNHGTNADGTPNEDYCIYCYKDGKFTQDLTMEQMIGHCAKSRDAVNAIIVEDPFHINGIADYQIVEFSPIMFADESLKLIL